LKHFIDLNCDLGEGIEGDTAIMPFISSANIACGAHAGSEELMRITVQSAIQHGVSIGAHPGFEDKEHFGRVEKEMSDEDLFYLVREQIKSLQNIAESEGGVLQHVKAHGALYHMVNQRSDYAEVFVRAVQDSGENLWIFTSEGSALHQSAVTKNIPVACEVFADRTYQSDGTLTPRSLGNAILNDSEQVVSQLLEMVRHQKVTSIDGMKVPVRVDTACLHGDTPGALALAQAVHKSLQDNHIQIKSFV